MSEAELLPATSEVKMEASSGIYSKFYKKYVSAKDRRRLRV